MDNILIITQRFPLPTDRGDKLRVFNISKQLSKFNNVYLLVLDDITRIDEESLLEARKVYKDMWGVPKSGISEKIDMIGSLFKDEPLQIAKFKSKSFNNKAVDIVSSYNINKIYGFHIRSITCLLNLKKIYPTIKVVCDLTDCMGLYISRMQQNTKSKFLKKILILEQKRIESYETKFIKDIDEFWIISEKDLNYHSVWVENRNKFKVISNGVNEELSLSYTKKDDKKIIFVGYMGIESIESLEWFLSSIFPLIKLKVPNITFDIIGKGAPQKFIDQINAIDGVNYLGYVKSLKDEYSNASISIAPMKFVAGQQNKILESMMASVPVVATTIANGGISAENGKSILLADDPNSFAECVISLLTNEEFRKKVSESSKEFVMKNYSWSCIPHNL